MKDFVDLVGASGASYRFRRARTVEPQRIAGNYAVLRPRAKGFAVLHVGATDDLSTVQSQCPPELLKRGSQLYIRLNVSRAPREAEHADLRAKYLAPSPASDEPR